MSAKHPYSVGDTVWVVNNGSSQIEYGPDGWFSKAGKFVRSQVVEAKVVELWGPFHVVVELPDGTRRTERAVFPDDALSRSEAERRAIKVDALLCKFRLKDLMGARERAEEQVRHYQEQIRQIDRAIEEEGLK